MIIKEDQEGKKVCFTIGRNILKLVTIETQALIGGLVFLGEK